MPGRDAFGQPEVFRRVDLVNARSENCNGAPASLQGSLVGNRINATSQATDNGDITSSQPGRPGRG